MADLGLLMVYWAESTGERTAMAGAATATEGFPTRQGVLDRYAERSGRDLSNIDFYTAFGYWKLACIIEGVYARYAAGAMGGRGDDSAHEVFAAQVKALADAAKEAVERF
jgi:aminoglycoside phosphotransferase (APT) family kinase protein